MLKRSLICSSLATIALLVFSASAFAAAPANDARESATALTVPQRISGTTVDATNEDGEPAPDCATAGVGSVWYSLRGHGKRVALGLEADGDLDAAVAVFQKARSTADSVECEKTDKNGVAVVAFSAKANTDYLILVEPRKGSVQGKFALTASTASEPADFPGPRLSSRGESNSVDLARNPSDAWSVRLKAGTTYRMNLSTPDGDYCVSADLISDSGDGDSVASLGCQDGYTLFTPGRGGSGRYSFSVEASRGVLGSQRYHLQLARAGSDDTGPGKFWGGKSIHGGLNGTRIDNEDLYNWDLDRKAQVSVRVTRNFDVTVRSVGGRYLGCSCDEGFSRTLKPGTYFATVSANSSARGGYTLKRTVKSITHTGITFNGSKHGLVSPGQSASITGVVFPASIGGITITLERKDPVYGWQFVQTYSGSGSGGSFSVSFVPPGVGEWRAKAQFKGSSSANPSSSGYAHLSVRR